jgi:hypothetical protein
MAIKISLIDGMGSATTDGSTVTLAGANASDFMHATNDVLYGAGVQDNTTTSCLVKQNSPAGMSVLVSAGVVYVPNDTYTVGTANQKYFRIENDADFSVAIAANSSGSTRIDLICAKADKVTAPNTTATNVGTFVRVAGTPGGGAPAVPALHTKIAEITVANGASSIVTANIADKREQMYVLNANMPEGFMQNGQIVRTVASNNLTVALKTKAGNDPSAISPVFVNIAGKTRKVTSALSVTLNSGTNQFLAGSAVTAAREIDYFTYMGYRVASDTVFLAFARLPYFATYADASATIANQAYLAYTGSAPASTDLLQVIGRFNATKSASAGFNWSVPATSVIVNKPITESRWLTWQPTYSASGSMTFTSVTTSFAKYIVRSPGVFEIALRAVGTVGGTISNQIDSTLPFVSANRTQTIALASLALPSGVNNAGVAFNSTNSNLVSIRTYDSGNWTAGTRSFSINGSIDIV